MTPPFLPDVKKRIDLNWFDKSKQFDLIDIERDMQDAWNCEQIIENFDSAVLTSLRDLNKRVV